MTAVAALGVGLLVLVFLGVVVVKLIAEETSKVRRDRAEARSIADAATRLEAHKVAWLAMDDPWRLDVPLRLQQQRVKGWRTPDEAVRVGAGTEWGNPWQAGDKIAMPDYWGSMIVTPQLAVDLYAAYIEERGLIDVAVQKLAGRDLVCWCPIGEPCHADWLLTAVNQRSSVLSFLRKAKRNRRVETLDTSQVRT